MQKVRYTVLTHFLPEDERPRRNAPLRRLGSFDFPLDEFVDLVKRTLNGLSETDYVWTPDAIAAGQDLLQWLDTEAASGKEMILLPDWQEAKASVKGTDLWYFGDISSWITANWTDDSVDPPVPTFPPVEAFCHECNQHYEFRELIKGDWRSGVSLAGRGGLEWRCPKQHRLIFVRTWIS